MIMRGALHAAARGGKCDVAVALAALPKVK